MCEVIKNHWGEYYVDTAEHFFDVGLRKITEIVGCIDHQLIFIGKNYDTNDANNYPSLKYKTYLMKNSNLKWDIVKTELID
ncbi:hypothetical protein UB42_13755 [Photobacterium leiognathi]|nr:hypothetical protein [Photobacterium leiognathi]KJF89346.1 hypothetical protein UB42_13755 [Photobacterium leiognathi]